LHKIIQRDYKRDPKEMFMILRKIEEKRVKLTNKIHELTNEEENYYDQPTTTTK